MKKALERRIRLSLKEIKTKKKTTKNTTKALNFWGETRSRGSWHKLSRWKWKCTRSKALALFNTEAAQAVGAVSCFGFFFFFQLRGEAAGASPRQLCPCRCLPSTTLLPAAHPCQQSSPGNSILGPVLYTWEDYGPSQFYLDLYLPPPEPPILPTKLASPEPGRAEPVSPK